MDLLEELQTNVLCGDGAMGTLLLESGIPLEVSFEGICLTEPERIERIHGQYIAAGARVIETNTFGANAVRLERFGLDERVFEINVAAAQIARKSARGKSVYVAGSVGPLGISGHEAVARGIDRGRCFREQVTALLEGGAQLIFFETFVDFEEIEIALRARQEVARGLSICSFTCGADDRLPCGTLLVDAFARMRECKAEIVGVNCINGPRLTVQLLEGISSDYVLSTCPNAGYPKYHEGRHIYHITPEDFANAAPELVAKGARLIGGCCGTTPKHIAAIAAAIGNLSSMRGKNDLGSGPGV